MLTFLFKITIIILIILLIIFTILNIHLILQYSCELFQNKKHIINNKINNNQDLHKSKYYGLLSGKNQKSLITKINSYDNKFKNKYNKHFKFN